ncbi:MAG: hypothetical protein FJ294_03390 [Planctomycetes bacterium]|nr:hypothetical protein [Planctomycetota bacterium]
MKSHLAGCLALSILAAGLFAQEDGGTRAREGEMDGYLGVPQERVSLEYGGGFSMHVAAWPLLGAWPGDRFQTGLFGTWMFAQLGKDKPEEGHYSDVEGGLGWWRDTRFATPTPKFIMGGVALEFVQWANGPGAGKGRDWDKPAGKYGVAQLSPWVLWPPDGLNLAQGTSGELFGYGYLPLPLAEPKAKTAGADVPSGEQCWTLFLDTASFKGPVAFFVPFFFTEATVKERRFAGMFLDSRPADPNRALQMETQYVPAYIARDEQGIAHARIAPTRFPSDAEGRSTLVHRIRSYRRDALWDGVSAWFAGGAASDGRVDESKSVVHTMNGQGWSTWRIHAYGTPKEERLDMDWKAFARPDVLEGHTFRWKWDTQAVRIGTDGLATLPEHFVAQAEEGKSARWRVAPEGSALPPALREVSFVPPRNERPEPYETPSDGAWAKPGPSAGPFRVELGDGSVVTYSWYRFCDQPALQHADLTREERERMQARVELLHRNWTKERSYLPTATLGKLAALDPGVLVTPPKGLEAGYVPIVTRQEAK